ncbi:MULTISPECIES: hypothetical protein [Sphingomonadales]|uniref:Uncharacterized protein n=2 Tax=Edaphosphingomonas TaxID=3423724 RepID=A0A2T4I651_9SPHN|nr:MULTISPECIES: hypothetical protein [Sphingomonas]AGH48415.1 hypothetical protein G432_03440 [Sphingomonas sp. MM-1]MDX3883405.1 hypothetical protein [Sphingomonas sp.]OHT20890.1 hypothetical protein BHE75_02894 [Sphingomonas haloaromaticamans]PTD26099.1 hypothetical protein CV103_03565 [Sphingomonas fennica]
MQSILEGVAGIAPAIAMLAVFALVAGGLYLMRKRHSRGKGALMLVAAAVLLANVMLWTLPV